MRSTRRSKPSRKQVKKRQEGRQVKRKQIRKNWRNMKGRDA